MKKKDLDYLPFYKMFNLNKKDTQNIEGTHLIFQFFNFALGALIALVCLILTITIAVEDEIMWLIPLGCLLVDFFVWGIIANWLQVQFGMYYDIRVTRLAAEKNPSSPKETPVVDNEEPFPQIDTKPVQKKREDSSTPEQKRLKTIFLTIGIVVILIGVLVFLDMEGYF